MILFQSSKLMQLMCFLFTFSLSTAHLTLIAAEPAATTATTNWHASVDKGVNFLKLAQHEDGSWSNPKTIGVTALCVSALVESGLTTADTSVKKGVDFLLQHKQPDGGIYHPETSHKNYETSIAVMALVTANKDAVYTKTIEQAVAFLKQIQWDDAEGATADNPAFGGQGYGSHKRPDLSNTQYFLDALVAAGISQDDPAYKKALTFVSRTQNLVSDENKTGHAEKINDGGFYYSPAAGGSSQAGTTPEGGLRSYASMTYAGLKSMIHCGLTKDDARVKAAFNWVSKFYSLSENPGLDQQGLYYYYHTLAKTLTVMNVESMTSPDGTKHLWKKELLDVITKNQQENGSWLNKTDRWYEGDPQLVTAYALLTLKYCKP